MIINNLQPNALWRYFEEICKIPRLSKNEDKIRKYLLDFAGENRLEARTDTVGNVLITKQADPGFENRKPVLLQSHMDMVGEKDADTLHDWNSDPITPIIDNGWVKADKTTLGADDGIGMAAQLAVLTDPELKTGIVECLFTVDEESGMTGALNLEPSLIKSKILLNLDSEDEGELFIGCAGGMDSVATIKFTEEKTSADHVAIDLSLTGLHGGHSGDEIEKGYGNSVKLINQLLTELDSRFGINIHHIDGGNLRNAIPREAFATIVFNKSFKKEIEQYIADYRSNRQKELKNIEPGFTISFKDTDIPGFVIDKQSQENLNFAIKECPHGVIAWSEDMENLVETSTNLASVKVSENIIKIVTSQRSSVESAKKEISARIRTIFEKAGAKVIHSDGYPGWEPDTNSEILRITADSYYRLFKIKPVVRAIHAGLECGLFLEKYPYLDMISFGPTIKGAHTPQERIDISTTQKFWDLLVDVLQNIPEA